MNINIDKTKVMQIGKKTSNISIKLDGRVVEQTESYRYLGVNIHMNGKQEEEINKRIESTTKLYYTLNYPFIRKKEISKKTKMVVYSTVFKPILTYGSESWVLNKQMKSKLQALEMKYLRGVTGITRKDRIRNDVVRKELCAEPVLKSIEKQQLRWFGHLARMKEERQTKRVWLARPPQKHPKGRPRKSWDQAVAECLKERGVSWKEGISLAQNKKEWAKFVYT